MKITIVGAGYVGYANALLLAQNNEVLVHDLDPIKIQDINNGKSPIIDSHADSFIEKNKLDLKATLNKKALYKDSQYVIIATPTDYDEATGNFDTESIETTIKDILNYNPSSTIVIKSTVPVGYTRKIKKAFKIDNIIFSPEFLREGTALYDTLNPSRIIVGDTSPRGFRFAKLIETGAVSNDTPILFTEPDEAEAIKLFSNTFLAMRVAFFNELDTYSETHKLESKKIIQGVCLDERIGDHYNNPSFGYGGYCLPKDTKQLRKNFQDIPNNLISAIVSSNATRKDFIASSIIKRRPKIVGIYRLAMKASASNFRESAIQGVINRIKEKNIKIIIYEPSLTENSFLEAQVINDLNWFKSNSDVIIANRISSEITDVIKKVYTRDLYGVD